LELKSTDVSSIHNYEYSYAFALAHTAGASNTRLSFVVSGTISVANNSQFSIAISDGEGSGDSVSLSGKAFIQEVGAIN
jgi:type II secretory pathway component PulC